MSKKCKKIKAAQNSKYKNNADVNIILAKMPFFPYGPRKSKFSFFGEDEKCKLIMILNAKYFF